MVRLAQQQLSSSAARANSCVPLTLLLSMVQQLLCCWHELIEQVPAFLQVVVRTLLPLMPQLRGCVSLLMQPVAAAAAAARGTPAASVQAGSSSSRSWEQKLQGALFGIHQAASMVLIAVDGLSQLDAGVAAEVFRLQNDPAVAEIQLQLLTAWTAQLHKQHTAQQQQQQLSAGASSSSTQQRQQSAKQQHRADLLPIPAFHQDMLQLLPGGQAYLDAAAEEAAAWGLTGEANAAQLQTYAGYCCQTISHYLHIKLQSIAGQQQLSRDALVMSGAAVRLALELQLLASGAVQRQREQHRQQQQRQQQVLSPQHQDIAGKLAMQTWELLRLQIRALTATSCSCLPPEVLQQAGLQLLQALAAPLQQWQLSRVGDFYFEAVAADMLRRFGDTLQVLVTAACGAQPREASVGEHDQCCNAVCLFQPWLLRLCSPCGIHPRRCKRKAVLQA
jgi:hypothetical protein